MVAGAYYYEEIAPGMANLAKAKEGLPPDCATLEYQLHQAFKQNHPLNSVMDARHDQMRGLRMCAGGAKAGGVKALQSALRDLDYRTGS